MSKLPLIAIAALFLATAGASSPSVAQGGCMSGNDPQARQLLETGQAIRLPDALARAGISSDQLAGNPQLCQSGGGFVYRVRIYQDGQVTVVSIPAS